MINDQKSLCAICGKSVNFSAGFLDHCHKTIAIRGILCRSCNSVLGFSYDNVKILYKAIKYLEISGTDKQPTKY